MRLKSDIKYLLYYWETTVWNRIFVLLFPDLCLLQESRCPVHISIVTPKTHSSSTRDASHQVWKGINELIFPILFFFTPSSVLNLSNPFVHLKWHLVLVSAREIVALTFLLIWGQTATLLIWVQVMSWGSWRWHWPHHHSYLEYFIIYFIDQHLLSMSYIYQR